MCKTVLISGGSGMIGDRLSAVLTQKGYVVNWLTRNPGRESKYRSYGWDIERMQIDAKALTNADYIVHLAGAGIAEKRWTAKRKKIIADSRIKGAELLYQGMVQSDHKPKAFLSASGISYYGSGNATQIYTEQDAPGTDFLSAVCVKWEAAARRVERLGIRSVQLRIPTVLSLHGGALPKMCAPFKRNLGAPLGSGKQGFPWIHLDDLVALYIHALERELKGPYNAVAPDRVQNQSFSSALAKAMHKAFFMPHIPAFILRLYLGEMSDLVLKSCWASPKKVMDTGFAFTYPSLELALRDIFA
ncbi:MAG: TIGR01777 family oxidoreductase [Flavobacteriales bacterium]